jgi:hypothetical protein
MKRIWSGFSVKRGVLDKTCAVPGMVIFSRAGPGAIGGLEAT